MEMIFWRQWNGKIVRCMMTLILAVGGSMKWINTLNICMINFKKIVEINYTYRSLTKTIAKNILWRITIFLFIRKRMREGGYLEQNKDG